MAGDTQGVTNAATPPPPATGATPLPIDDQPQARPERDNVRTQRERRIFWIILWISSVWSWMNHMAELTDERQGGIAGAVLIGLAIWLHGVHKIHRWSGRASTTRLVTMLLGVYAVVFIELWIAAPYLVMLFGAYAVTFAFSDRVRIALPMSLLLTVIWTWGWFRWDLPEGGASTPMLVWAVLNVINHFATRISDQSEDRGRLLDELERTRSQLAIAERRQGTLAERERLAAEIHDTLAQGFTSIVLVSEATRLRADQLDGETINRHLAMIEDTARSNLNEARRLVDALRPASLEGRSLTQALRTAADRVAQRTGATASVNAQGDDAALSGSIDVVLLRVAQEALANIEKHAKADTIHIRLTVDDTEAILTVRDNGDGFDAGGKATEAGGVVGGHGMTLMRERIESVGGTLAVDSAAGAGTSITATLPTAAAPS